MRELGYRGALEAIAEFRAFERYRDIKTSRTFNQSDPQLSIYTETTITAHTTHVLETTDRTRWRKTAQSCLKQQAMVWW